MSCAPAFSWRYGSGLEWPFFKCILLYNKQFLCSSMWLGDLGDVYIIENHVH